MHWIGRHIFLFFLIISQTPEHICNPNFQKIECGSYYGKKQSRLRKFSLLQQLVFLDHCTHAILALQ